MRMRRKDEGFTLIELLVTIALLSLVAVIALVFVNNLTDDADENRLKINEKSVLAAGKEYTLEFTDFLQWVSNEAGTETIACISVEEVIKNGFLSESLVNEKCDNESCKSGNYKDFSIKVTKTEFDVNSYALVETNACTLKDDIKPTIKVKLSGEMYDINSNEARVEIAKGESFDLVTNVEYNGTGTKVVETKITYNGNDITTTKDLDYGEHKITYYAKDQGGQETSLERTVKILDKVAPVITSFKQDPKTDNYSTNTVTLVGEAKDDGIGLIAYKFTQDPQAGDSDWHKLDEISQTLEKQYSEANKNGNWYFHVKDAHGNIAISEPIQVYVDNVIPEYVSKNGSMGYNSVPTATFKDDHTTQKDIIVKYLITTSSITPANNNAGFTTNKSVSMSCYNTYYAWAIGIDKAGNTSKVTGLGNYYYDCWEDDDDDYYYEEEEDTCDWLCQMEQNSEAWWEAETEEEKKALEEANKELAEANGLSKEDNFDDGQWKDDNGDNLYEVSGGNKS